MKSPEQVLEKIIAAAVGRLRALAGSRAFNIRFTPIYRERKTKLGLMYDFNIVMEFEGPVEPGWRHLKDYAEMKKVLAKGGKN